MRGLPRGRAAGAGRRPGLPLGLGRGLRGPLPGPVLRRALPPEPERAPRVLGRARQPRLVRRAHELPARVLPPRRLGRRLAHRADLQLLRAAAAAQLVAVGDRHPVRHLPRHQAARLLQARGRRARTSRTRWCWSRPSRAGCEPSPTRSSPSPGATCPTSRRTTCARAARALAATLTGDLHHYCRYSPAAAAEPVRITAGGGGAYLSPTHTLERHLRLRSLHAEESVPYERALRLSRRARVGAHARRRALQARRSRTPASRYLMAGRLRPAGRHVARCAWPRVAEGWWPTRGWAASRTTSARRSAAAPSWWPCCSPRCWSFYADTPGHPQVARRPRSRRRYTCSWCWGSSTPCCFPSACARGACRRSLAGTPGAGRALGLLLGPVLFACFLVGIGAARRGKARRHDDHAFAGQAIRATRTSCACTCTPAALTIHPLGVREACTRWEFHPRAGPRARPELRPAPGHEPQVEPIEDPIELA